MCGLVGMVGDLGMRDEEVQKRLLLDDYWRGEDSTGMAAIRRTGDVALAKMSSHPLHLFETPKFKQALHGSISCAFLGHNRKATRGSVTDYNSHPFHVGHIVGAHNGTLHYTSQRDLEKELGDEFPVDSLAIVAAISHLGISETVKRMEGAWALSWVDLKEGTVNFLRNKDRPLWFARTKDGKKFYYASEWTSIFTALRGNTSELHRDTKSNCFFEFNEDTHVKYSIADFVTGKTQKPTVKKLEGKKPTPFVNASSNYGRHTPSSSPWTRNSTTPSPTLEETFVTVKGSVDDPYAGIVSKEEFEELSYTGCAFCEQQLKYGDRGITIWKDDAIVLCPEHSAHSDADKTRIYVKTMPRTALAA